MPTKLALAYRQDAVDAPVVVSERFDKTIIRLDAVRRSPSGPEHALAALLGRSQRLSSVLGEHPDYPNGMHPVHQAIQQDLIACLTNGVAKHREPLLVDKIDNSVVVIGGPLASRHAALLFGSPSHPSILPSNLPVHFNLSDVEVNISATHRRASFKIDGIDNWHEHLLITSLPMGEHRILNICSLSGAGGLASKFLLNDERFIHQLFVRNRSLQDGGWQALFKVNLANGEATSIDDDFRIFEVLDIDFDSRSYPLNDTDFLLKKENDLLFIEKNARTIYHSHVDRASHLSDILTQARAFVEKFPDAKDDLVKAFSKAISDEPSKISELKRPSWSDVNVRNDRNPAQFIRDEYSDMLLAETLTRTELRKIDHKLYQSYASWIRPSRHPEDDLGLPTQARVNLDSVEDPVARQREKGREAWQRYKARKGAQIGN